MKSSFYKNVYPSCGTRVGGTLVSFPLVTWMIWTVRGSNLARDELFSESKRGYCKNLNLTRRSRRSDIWLIYKNLQELEKIV